MLAAATVAISLLITEDTFVKIGRCTGDTSQVAAVTNECLNPILVSNTTDNIVDVGNCAGTVLQKDESGQASALITSQTANPDIELQRATTTTTRQGLGSGLTACESCFSDNLGVGELGNFEDFVNSLPSSNLLADLNVIGGQPVPITGVDTPLTPNSGLCQLLQHMSGTDSLQQALDEVERLLEASGIYETSAAAIRACLKDLFNFQPDFSVYAFSLFPVDYNTISYHLSQL